MAEVDVFEARLGSAVRRYLEDAPLEVDAAAVTRRVTSERQRRRFLPGIRPLGLSPAVVWLIVAALLAVVAVAVLVAGAGPDRRDLPALVPPVAPVTECPAGSTPDQPGPAGQARPISDSLRMAFDRSAGRILALVPSDDFATWTTWIFDVCTNTWARPGPAGEPWPLAAEGRRPIPVYDADSGLTIALDGDGNAPLAYDARANAWTTKAGSPVSEWPVPRSVYDPVSGLVYVQRISSSDGATPPRDLWTYDVDSDTWAPVRQAGGVRAGQWDTSGLYAFDPAADRIVAVLAHPNRSATWRFDPRSGQWTAGASGPRFNTGFFASGGEIAFDEASKRIVVFSDGHVGAYDTSLDTWETIYGHSWTAALPSIGPHYRQGHWMVYDPLNERLVVAGGAYRTSDSWVRADDVWAFDTATREWIELLAPGRIELFDDATEAWQPLPSTEQP